MVSPENGEPWLIFGDEPTLETKHHHFQVKHVHLPGCMAAKEMQLMIGFMIHVVLFWWAEPLLWKLVAWKVKIVYYFVISWLHSR